MSLLLWKMRILWLGIKWSVYWRIVYVLGIAEQADEQWFDNRYGIVKTA